MAVAMIILIWLSKNIIATVKVKFESVQQIVIFLSLLRKYTRNLETLLTANLILKF